MACLTCQDVEEVTGSNEVALRTMLTKHHLQFCLAASMLEDEDETAGITAGTDSSGSCSSSSNSNDSDDSETADVVVETSASSAISVKKRKARSGSANLCTSAATQCSKATKKLRQDA